MSTTPQISQICTRCKQKNESPSHRQCPRCIEYGRRYLAYRKSNKICPDCGQHNDRHPRTRCTSCVDKRRIRLQQTHYYSIYYRDHKISRNKDKKDIYYDYKLRAMQLITGAERPNCVSCGNKDIRILTINHKNGGGKKELTNKHNVTATKFYFGIVRLTRKTDDLDIRCYNCNILYEYERGTRSLPDWLIPFSQ